MADTNFFVMKGAGAGPLNGGGPRYDTTPGANLNGPVDTAPNCTGVEIDGQITNNDGPFTDVQENDYILWDEGGANELLLVTSVVGGGAVLNIYGGFTGGVGKTVNVGGAFATIDFSMSTINSSHVNGPGDPPRVNIEAGTWLEAANLDNAASPTIRVAYEGFTTTPGDGGVAIIDGEDIRACITSSIGGAIYTVFKNIKCTRSTSHGFDLTGETTLSLIGCEGSDNAGAGIYTGSYVDVLGCTANENGSQGIRTGSYAVIEDCTVLDNTGEGIYTSYSSVRWCVVRAGGDTAIYFHYLHALPGACVNNTVDGNGKTRIGLEARTTGSTGLRLLVANNIFYKCSTGVSLDDSECKDNLGYGRNNLFFDCTTNMTNWEDDTGDVTGFDPLFWDVASDDYRIKGTSPARGAGWPDGLNIGAGGVVDNETHLVKALLHNKRAKNLKTGVLTIYDDDGTTVLATVTPSLSGDTITLTPSWVADGTPGTFLTELHYIKAFLLNKREKNIVTQALKVYDDDGATELFTATPTTVVGVTTVESS